MDNSHKSSGILQYSIFSSYRYISLFIVSVIKALQEEVGRYHQMTSELEKECGSVSACHSTHHQELKEIKDEIKVDFP